MPDRVTANLPDLLGAITRGARLNIDLVQCALGVRPPSSPAGRTIEAVLLLQNTADADVDVTARIMPPQRDAARKKNRFAVAREQVTVGLRPGEAGYLSVPVNVSPETAPDGNYVLHVDLSVKCMAKGRPVLVREAEGGGKFDPDTIRPELKAAVRQLRQVQFSAKRAGRSGVDAGFAVTKAAPGESPAGTVGWHSLWTMADYVNEDTLVARAREQLVPILQTIKRQHADIYFSLLDVVQTRFHAAGYPLWAGESVFAAKALMMALERDMPAEGPYPKWMVAVSRALSDDPGHVTGNLAHYFSVVAFEDLVWDAARLGLSTIATTASEDFGSPAEQDEYIGSVAAGLKNGEMDFAHTYLPLVLAGLIANTRVVLPQERPRETIWLLHKAYGLRARERDEYNEPIFSMAEDLIDRALDQAG